MPKLTYTTPPPTLMIELREVAADARELATELAQANQLPSSFPTEQLQELLTELQSLPHGTAEGCRPPLEYARSRLPAIRRKFIQTEEQSRQPRVDEDAPPPLTRGMVIDQCVGALVNSVTTALDEYRALASIEIDEAADTAPSFEIDATAQDALEAIAAARRAEQKLNEGIAEVARIAEPASSTADDLKRQMRDAFGLLQLARIELRMPEFVPRWYRKTIDTVRDYPRILQKTAKAVRMGVDVARPMVDAWSHFLHGYKTLILDSVEQAANGLEAVGRKWETEQGGAKAAQIHTDALLPPSDFNLDVVHEMILAGRAPKPSWRPWIKDLNFTSESLSELSPLADLSSLKTLALDRTLVEKLGPLRDLTSLQTLNLDRTGVIDLGPIANLPSLKILILSRTKARDLTPLVKLSELLTLVLDGTSVADLESIAGLRKLQRLSLNDTQVSDIASLSGLISLQTLMLSRTRVLNLSPLTNLSALKVLDLDSLPTPDLSPLTPLTALFRLNLHGMPVANLAPIATLETLRTLTLVRTQVHDLGPLLSLRALEKLNLSDTLVTNLTPLGHLTKLRRLTLNNTGITDLKPLRDATALEQINLSHTLVTDLSPLLDLKNLSRVFVESKQRRDTLAKTFGRRGNIIHVPK
jgi:hypothetical protein